MQEGIHPNYKALKIILTNGNEFTTYSTLEADKFITERDIFSHPAWTGEMSKVNEKAEKVERFNKKFGGLFGASKKEE